jgi:DNA-binding response OmpR family regulator
MNNDSIVSRLGETRFLGGSAVDYMRDHGRTAFTEARRLKSGGLVGNGSAPSRECAILKYLLRRLDRVVLNTVFEGKLINLDELQSNAISVHAPRLRRNLVDGGAAAEINTMDGANNLLAEAQA